MATSQSNIAFALLVVFVSLQQVVRCGDNNIVNHMKPLVNMEKDLLTIARTYLKDQKRKLAELEPFAESIRETLKLSSGENGVRYLGNPINCYLMIKRYTSGWKELPPRLEVDEASLNKVQRTLDESKMFMPSGDDVANTLRAVSQLVEEQGVRVGDIVEGNVGGMALQQLTAEDCIKIADLCQNSEQYDTAKLWLVEAERLLRDDTNEHRHGDGMTLSVLHRRLAQLQHRRGDVAGALAYVDEGLKDDPMDKQLLKMKDEYSGAATADHSSEL